MEAVEEVEEMEAVEEMEIVEVFLPQEELRLE